MSSTRGRGDWRQSRWAILVGCALLAVLMLIPRLTHSLALRLVGYLAILAFGVYMAIGFVRRLTPKPDDRAGAASTDDRP